MFSKSCLGFLMATLLGATAAAQELPAEVMDNYAAFQTAASENDWPRAARAITQAAETGDRLGVDAASRMVLWENAGVAQGRAGRLAEAEAALERALSLSNTVGDSEAAIRLRYRLITTEVQAGDGAAALERMDEFETAIAATGYAYPQFERQVLTLRVASGEPYLGIRSSRPFTPAEAARVARLDTLTSDGDAGDIAVRRRRVFDAAGREDWDAALDQVLAALSVAPESSGTTETRDGLFKLYSDVMAVGFDDLDSDGRSRLPEDLHPEWCAYLDREIVWTDRTEPVYPSVAAQWGVEGTLRVNYQLSPYGRPIDIDLQYEGIGERDLAEAIDRAMRQWHWRPVCDPEAGEIRNAQTEFIFTLDD